VVNDQVAKDPIQKVLLPKASRGVKTSVLSVSDTIQYIKDSVHDKEVILLVVKFPLDTIALLEGGVVPEQINVGNQAPISGTKYKMVTHSIAVTEEDARVYREIEAKGFHLTSQMLPTDSRSSFVELLGKKGM
jgi:PTS system mannose-specific IIB component